MDGSSDIERRFSELELVECRRAKRHHSEQFLQDLLKVRLHAPEGFRRPQLAGSGWERVESAFILASQRQHAEFFGTRLASRSLEPVSPQLKRELFATRRPRWQHAHPRSARSCAARTAEWDTSVQTMLSATAEEGAARRESFAGSAVIDLVEEARALERAEAVFGKRREEHAAQQQKAELADRLSVTGPPPALQLSTLLDAPPKKLKTLATVLRRSTAPGAAPLGASSSTAPLADVVRTRSTKIVARPGCKVLRPPPCLAGAQLPPAMRVYCTAAAVAKHRRTVGFLLRKGLVVPTPNGATHRIYAGKDDKAAATVSCDSAAEWCSTSALLRALRPPERA